MHKHAVHKVTERHVTHTHTHACTHAHTHACTHTHAHTQRVWVGDYIKTVSSAICYSNNFLLMFLMISIV